MTETTTGAVLDKVIYHGKVAKIETAMRTLMFWCEPEEIMSLTAAAFKIHAAHLRDSFQIIPPTPEGFALVARLDAFAVELEIILTEVGHELATGKPLGQVYAKGVDGTYEPVTDRQNGV